MSYIFQYLIEEKFLKNNPPKPNEYNLALKNWGFNRFGKNLEMSEILEKLKIEIDRKLFNQDTLKVEIKTDVKIEEVINQTTPENTLNLSNVSMNEKEPEIFDKKPESFTSIINNEVVTEIIIKNDPEVVTEIKTEEVESIIENNEKDINIVDNTSTVEDSENYSKTGYSKKGGKRR